MPNNVQLGIGELLKTDGMRRVFIDLFLLGFAGGIFIVPMYAFMQAYSPETHRARIIGANNIFNALFMVGSAIFAMVCLAKMSIPSLFAVVGIINVLFGIWVFMKLKKYQTTAKIAA